MVDGKDLLVPRAAISGSPSISSTSSSSKPLIGWSSRSMFFGRKSGGVSGR